MIERILGKLVGHSTTATCPDTKARSGAGVHLLVVGLSGFRAGAARFPGSQGREPGQPNLMCESVSQRVKPCRLKA